MTYSSLDPVTHGPNPRFCSRGGGRNSNEHMTDIIEEPAFSRESTAVPGWRVIDFDGFCLLAKRLNIQERSARSEFKQIVARGRIEAVHIGDGDYRFRVVR